MPAYATVRSGRWDDANPATNPWGVAAFPVAGDTVTINNTHQVDVNAISGDEACASFTSIAATGKLHIEGGAKLTTTGTAAWAGEVEIIENTNADPTELVVGGIWTLAATAVIDIGTAGVLPYNAPGIKITGSASAYFDFVSRSTITGTWKKCEFVTFGHANGVLFRVFSYEGSGLTISDLYFNGIAGTGECIYSVSNPIYLTGTLLFANGSVNYSIYTHQILGSATLIIQGSVATNDHILYGCTVCGTTVVNVNEKAGASKVQLCRFIENSRLIVLDVDASGSINTNEFLDDSYLTLSTTTNARILTNLGIVNTDGQVRISGQNGIQLFNSGAYQFVVDDLEITVTTGTVILASAYYLQSYWQAARDINFAIIGSTAVTLNGTGAVPQYEPVLYKYDLTNYLFAIQYDMTVGCPNYTALYGASTGWTAATKTLAAGGVLRIYSTGHTATGMDMAISDLSGFTLATTGTATINTAEYYISFDGGTLWSGALTLTQLRANSYTINGNSYTTDPTSDIQLRIVLTSTLGGTVTQVSVTGIEYDPVNLSSYNIRDDLTAVKGAGFVTGTHDLKSIHDDLYTVNNYTTALSGLSYRSGKVHAVCSGLFEANSKFFKVKYF